MDFPAPFEDTSAELPDSIASLVAIADSMEALLPPDLTAPPPPPPVPEMSCVTMPPPHDKSAALALSLAPAPAAPIPTHALAHPAAAAAAAADAHPPGILGWFPDQAEMALFGAVPPLDVCTSPTTTTTTTTTSPCALRDLELAPAGVALGAAPCIRKPVRSTGGGGGSGSGSGGRRSAGGSGAVKTGRKPKTYSKPVASRFCHICSRMPRRGQGSATCRRMAEGFCRKIVCEQCLRDQGFDYAAIAARPTEWTCPHCAEKCPPRSQCHIYNRINARRKRVGKGKKSVEVAVRSADVLLGPYGHLLQEQILQPPPNFRLNLPPQYSQL